MIQNAVIYTRVSTQEQDYERQINELQKYAEYKGYKVLSVFSEKITGNSKISDRAEFSKLINFAETNKVDHILVWELSRLGRNMIDCLNTINYFTDKKINIYSKKEGLNSLNDKGEKDVMINIITSVFSGMAEMELATTKARSISGLRAAAAAGKAGGTKLIPFGYRKDTNKMLVVDEEESKVIREIFDLYINGLGTTQIANHLNNNNIKTRYQKAYGNQKIKYKNGIEKAGNDHKWVDGVIYFILKNSIYCGKRRYKGEIFAAPAIISEEKYEAVQELLKSNYNKKGNNTKYENLLKNKLVCGVCGRSYFMHKRADKKDNAYKCLSKRYKENCGNASANIDKLDNLVYLFLNEYENDEINLSHKIAEIENKIKIIEIEKNNEEAEINKINERIEKLLDIHLDGLITKEKYTEKYNELLETKKKAESVVKKVKNQIKDLKKLKNKAEEGSNDVLIDDANLAYIIQEKVEFVKIREIKNKEYFQEEFTNKQDKLLLIQIKLYLSDDTYAFIITQRSPYSLWLGFFDLEFEDILKLIQEKEVEYIKKRIDFNPYEIRKQMKEEMGEVVIT